MAILSDPGKSALDHPSTAENIEALNQSLNDLALGSDTYLKSAFEVAIEQVAIHGQRTTIVIITDGEDSSIQELIDTIDEDIVDAVGILREEFIVHVFQGRETGVFSDNDFGENGNEN